MIKDFPDVWAGASGATLSPASAVVPPTNGGAQMTKQQTVIETGGDSSCRIVVGDRQLQLTDFLLQCAQSINEQHSSPNRELSDLRDAFLEAGLTALRARTRPSSWVQMGLQVPHGRPHPELYRRLASTARQLLEQPTVANCFFMHKPPGLRVRFETTESALEQDIYERVALWVEEGLIERVVPAVYEPEAHLFGGPVSMRSVHRLFTIDALAWLDFHTLAGATGEQPGPAWALSLVMLRALFDGLEIVGWEDLDVWDRVRSQTGRRLGEQALAHDGLGAVASTMRAAWADHRWLLTQLPLRTREIAEAYRSAIVPEAARWRSDYFATRQAYIGPREAAAYFAVFHWNRAGLPSVRQALVAESLAARQVG